MQRTWLALVEQIHRINEPAAIGGWLAATARNQSLRALDVARREVLTAEVEHNDARAGDEDGEQEIGAARTCAVRAALERVSGRERALLQLLSTEPAPSYARVSARLSMPVGSIGPTRARCIARLRRDPDVADLMTGSMAPVRPTRPLRHGTDDLM